MTPRESLISRYELIGRLGSGGMAEVFVARALGIADFEKVVVLKRIRPDKQDDPRFVGMLRDEARVAAVLDHPNIVHTYDVGIDDVGVFIAMEFIDGEDVRTLLDRVRKALETIPLPLALQIAAGAAAGLHHAHEQTDSRGTPLSIVHRDVSPANIIVTRHSTVKLIDFGIAKAGSAREQTAVGVLKGKVAYMSPEQVKGEKLDRRSDIFALGIVIYELVTMVRPFEADNHLAIMHQICNEKHKPADEQRPTLPPALGRLLDRALAKDPADRYPTAFDLLEDLERITRDESLHALPGALGRYLEHVFGPKVPPWLTPAQARAHVRGTTTQTKNRSWDLSPVDVGSSTPLEESMTVTSKTPRAKATEVVEAVPSEGRPPRAEPSMLAGVAVGFSVAMGAFGIGWWLWPRSEGPVAEVPKAAIADVSKTSASAAARPPALGEGVADPTPAPAVDLSPDAPAPVEIEPEVPDPNPTVLPESTPVEEEPTAPKERSTAPTKREQAAQRAAKAEELLDEAGKAMLAGKDKEALSLVERSLKLRRTTAGYAKLATIACRLGDARKAATAHAKLSGRTKDDVERVCAARGIVLP